jgi:hypothetical protein
MSQTSSRKLVTWAVILATFSVALLGAIGASLFDVWRAQRAMTWPTTHGVVVESRFAPGCGRNGTGYHTLVRYRYQVGGAGYESRRILFGAASCDSKQAALNMTNRYSVASTVKVSFDPELPGEAVLIAGKVDASTWAGIYFMVFWLLLTAAATGMLVIVIRSTRPTAPDRPPQPTPGLRP